MQLIHGDCLEKMKDIQDGSINMVFADPPYGMTACKWDSVIPLEPMWKQLKRIIRKNGVIIMTASQPFTTTLISSNLKMFRYEWIWGKTLFSNFALVSKQPAKLHENICVFYRKQPIYNAQKTKGKPYIDTRRRSGAVVAGGKIGMKNPIHNTGTRWPSSIQRLSNGNNKNVHPTQKPVALMEYMIKTYTNEGDKVLDFCMGSGTTGVACKNLNREFSGIEKDEAYFKIAKERIEAA